MNEDVFVSTGIGILGSNMYAYCNNNPVNSIDSLGLWTVSVSGTISVAFGLGISASIGIALDDEWNFEVQYSYSAFGIDNTAMVGGVGAGIGGTIQYTRANTVYDLHGPSTAIGASVGPSWYVGGDIISFSDASDLNMTHDGAQITVGVGCGVDIHIVESYTRPVQLRQKSVKKIPVKNRSQNVRAQKGNIPTLY